MDFDNTLVSALDSAGRARVYHRRVELGAQKSEPTMSVLALDVGGRWSPEAAQFVRLLARARARSVPQELQSCTAAAFRARWSALLSFATARAFAASLLFLPGAGAHNLDADCRFVEAQAHSRLPVPGR